MKSLSRRMLALLLCVAMLAGYLGFVPSAVEPITAEAATTMTNPNLLADKNPDFETVDDIEGWTVSDKSAVFLSNTLAKNGKLSLKIKDSSNKGTNYARSGKIAIAVGEVYYAAVSANGTTHGVLTLRFYDDAGKEMTAATISKTTATATPNWEALNIKTTAPEGAKTAEVELSTTAAGVGAVYFDDAAFYAEPGASEVENPSFEGGFDGNTYVPEGWTAWGGPSPLRQINTDPNYVKTGKQSMKFDVKFNASGSNTAVGIRSSAIDAIVGSYYAFDFWVKAEPFTNKSSICFVYVNFTDVDGNILDLKGNIIASNQFSYNQKLSITTEWQNIRNGVTAPVNATKVQVLFITSTATASATYVDDLKIELDKTVAVAPNPSFEEGVDSKGMPNGWTNYGGAFADVTLVTDEKTDGTYAVKIDNVESKKYSGISVWLPIREGEQWKLTLDKKGNVQAYLLYFTGDKSTRVSTHQATSSDKSSDWKTVTVTATAESSSTGSPGMMQILIYTSGTTPGVSYVDNLKLERTKAAEIPTFSNQIINGNFEKRKTVVGWSNMNFNYIQTDEKAGGDRGNFVVQLVDTNKNGATQFVTPQYPCTPGKYYCGVADCVTDTSVQVYVRFYDKDNNRLIPSTFSTVNNTNGEWVRAGSLSRAPDKAVKVEMLFGTTMASVGTAYCDNLFLGEYNAEKDPDIMGMTSLKSPSWDDVNFDEVGHPRVFFTEDELAKLRKSVSYGYENDLGYSIRDSYVELLEAANGYVDEKSFRIAWTGVELIYDLDKFPDINTQKEIQSPPPGYTSGAYPYFSGIGSQLQNRMQTLALAYAISQKEEYAQRAIHYAMKLCDWKIWSQADAIKTSATDMGCSYVTIAASIVYDMCYDLLTPEQRVKLYTNIVEKGLKPLRQDSEALVNFNVNLSRVNAIMVAASAIAEESNRDLVEPFLTLGYNYSKWYLDELYESGWQEGYSYTDHALEAVITGIDVIGRATGKEGFMDHPYFEEILMDWLIYGMAPGSGKQPAISDSPTGHHFFKTCMLLNKTTGSKKAGFYLKESGILETSSAFEMLLYSSPEPKMAERKDLYQTTTVIDEIGYGFLRSGWDALDVNLTIVANQSKHTHNHWDQNAINISFNSMDMAADFGYASIGGSSTAPGYIFGYWGGHNTIFVDGEAQDVKGAGQMTEVVGNTLYGQITGEAADAYGGRLNQFDRHAILINHWDKPYYVIIDELDSDSEHVYNWNLYTRGWNGLQFEDKAVDVGSSAVINQFAVTKDRDAMFVTIVNNGGLNVRAFNAEDSFPIIQIDSPKTKTHEFMTIISMEEEVCKDAALEFNSLFRGYLYGQDNSETDKILWHTSYKGGSEVIKKVTVEGYDCVFFRGAAVGDFYEMYFDVETTGTFNVKLSLPMSPNYGTFKVYWDGVACENTYNGYGSAVRMTNYEIGLMEVTAGRHTIRMEVVGRDARSDDYLISCGGVILSDPNKPAAVSTLNVVETYDDANVLGATVRYGTLLKDVILHNRGTGTISAGGITTNGAQAAVMGIYENEITQGFSVTNATSMKFGDTVLMTSTAPVTVAVDSRAVKKQIQNTEHYVSEYPEEEDINRGIPTTYITTNAAAACAVSLNIGKDAPYTATIDGVATEVTYKDGMVTINVPAGNHDVKIVGTHTCVFDQKVERIAHLKARATCEAPAQYYYSCLCEANGTECFQAGEPSGHRWASAKVQTPATCSTEGVLVSKCRNCNMMQSEPIPTISHKLVKDGMFWGCTECGAYFANAAGTMTMNTFILIVSISAGAFVLLAGGTVALLIIMKKRKRTAKADAEVPADENVEATEDPTE